MFLVAYATPLLQPHMVSPRAICQLATWAARARLVNDRVADSLYPMTGADVGPDQVTAQGRAAQPPPATPRVAPLPTPVELSEGRRPASCRHVPKPAR